MTQVAETHIDACISSEIFSQNFQTLSIMKYGNSSKVALISTSLYASLPLVSKVAQAAQCCQCQ